MTFYFGLRTSDLAPEKLTPCTRRGQELGNTQGIRGMSLYATSHRRKAHAQLRGIPVKEASSEKESGSAITVNILLCWEDTLKLKRLPELTPTFFYFWSNEPSVGPPKPRFRPMAAIRSPTVMVFWLKFFPKSTVTDIFSVIL